jgi:hypothetical protein
VGDNDISLILVSHRGANFYTVNNTFRYASNNQICRLLFVLQKVTGNISP